MLLPDRKAMAERLQAAGTEFVLTPQVRLVNQPVEQRTMFCLDPFGNPIEIKGFRDLAAMCATCAWAQGAWSD